MIFAIELKKCVASTGILGVVVDKFRYRKKPCPIILFEIDKGLTVGFYYTILPFGLTVHLWVEGGEESSLNAKEIA